MSRSVRRTLRGLVTPAVLMAALILVVAGCRTSSSTPPEAALTMACDQPRGETLGVPTTALPAWFTTSGGRLRFLASSLPPGSILGDVNDTEVRLSDIDSPSDDIRYRVRASPGQPGVIDVDAGTYRVVNSARGKVKVQACPEVALSAVKASLREPRGGSTTPPTSTPSGAPPRPPTDDSTPGTATSGS